MLLECQTVCPVLVGKKQLGIFSRIARMFQKKFLHQYEQPFDLILFNGATSTTSGLRSRPPAHLIVRPLRLPTQVTNISTRYPTKI
jgi:hypothetical protein